MNRLTQLTLVCSLVLLVGCEAESPLDCRGVFQCATQCSGGTAAGCEDACVNRATPTARTQVDALVACNNAHGCTPGTSCLETSCSAQVVACTGTSGAGGGGGGGGGEGPQLPEIKAVADQTRNDCKALEDQMRCAVGAASGNGGSCGDGAEPELADLSEVAGKVELPSKVQPFVSCATGTASAPLQVSGGGYTYRGKGGAVVSCSFDRGKCEDQKLTENSDTFMREKLGLPKVLSNLAQSLGGSETRKPSQGGSNPKNFCTCAFSEKPVDPTMVGISDAVRKIASFGAADDSEALRKKRDYRSCGRWYFPARSGEFASTPEDEQPFVAAWKWNQTTKCEGGGS